MSSIWGNNIKISIFGESHGKAVGAIIDGFPAGVNVDMDYILKYMKRRMPGGNFSTHRKEVDFPIIKSGVHHDITTGAPICVLIENLDQKSESYDESLIYPRPNHADYTSFKKYNGYNDLRGGGHYSGRLTAPIVFAGALCSLVLQSKGIDIAAHIKSIKHIEDMSFDPCNVSNKELVALKEKAFPVLDDNIASSFADIINEVQNKGDSVGAKIECAIVGVQPAIGAHMFKSVEGNLSSIMFGIPAIKGIEFGDGFNFANLYGSEANDEFQFTDDAKNRKVITTTNHCGGILGGMSNGMPIIFSVVLKPTPSIFIEQNTVNLKSMQNDKLTIKGRHDPCIAVRAVPVIECAAAIAILDLIL